MTRILIADDLIPERSFLSDQEVRNHYLMKYKDDRNAVELAEWFVFFRKLMLLLRERGYEVDGANTPVTALDCNAATLWSARHPVVRQVPRRPQLPRPHRIPQHSPETCI